jgi:hypothetical protein
MHLLQIRPEQAPTREAEERLAAGRVARAGTAASTIPSGKNLQWSIRMRIAAIALASALVSVAFAQPGFAQSGSMNDRDQNGPSQYGPGPHNQFRGGMDRDQDTFGQRDNWRRDGNWRSAERNDWRDDWRRDGASMHGPMGMMMGPRMRERAAEERGASFSFGNGRARMSVHCPTNEPVETCVRAASQLLDKITSLRSGTSASTPSGANTGSGIGDSGRSGSSSGSNSSSGSGSVQQDEQ